MLTKSEDYANPYHYKIFQDMIDKYKIVSLVLTLSLIAALVRLVYSTNIAGPSAPQDDKASVLKIIHERKSVRSFTEQPAPTGKNMQPWKFIVIDDKEAMTQLSEQLPYAKMLKEAQAAVIVCGDMSVVDDNGKPSTNWVMDCSAATENLLLAAEAMGLGAVWTGVYPYEERLEAVKKAFNLPENIIPIGYPKGEQHPKDKYKPDNIHYNGW